MLNKSWPSHQCLVFTFKLLDGVSRPLDWRHRLKVRAKGKHHNGTNHKVQRRVVTPDGISAIAQATSGRNTSASSPSGLC